jgi:hypothetical protein
VWDLVGPLSPLIPTRDYSGMDGIDLLRREALLTRNAAILKAKRDYHNSLKEINKLRDKLRLNPHGRPRKATEDPLMKATTVAVTYC